MTERYELENAFPRKSFYGKAYVEKKDNGDRVLISYGTPVLKKDANGRLHRLWWNWSATTGRHIAAFAGIGKKEWDKLPIEEV